MSEQDQAGSSQATEDVPPTPVHGGSRGAAMRSEGSGSGATAARPMEGASGPVSEPVPAPEPMLGAEPVTDGAEPDTATDPQPESQEPTWRRFDVTAETSEALAAAQSAIAAGECIVLPTDTVYGIGANAFSATAVQGLLDAKHRGRDMPPPVLVAETGMLEALADDLPTHALRLAEAFWPGALTLIVKAQSHLRMDLGETNGTIAVRVPDHDFTRDLLRRTGPLAVSSANVSGRPSSTTIDEAVEQLGNSVPVYLDAGATPGLTPSTILDFVSEPLGKVVRLGALSVAQLREVDPFLVHEDEEPEAAEPVESTPVASDDEHLSEGDPAAAPVEAPRRADLAADDAAVGLPTRGEEPARREADEQPEG